MAIAGRVALRVVGLLLLTLAMARGVVAQEATRREAGPGAREIDGATGGEAGAGGGGPEGQTGGSGARAEVLPDPFGRVLDRLDPGRYHRLFDESIGLDALRSPKPRAPELPLALFVESIRPLGALTSKTS